VLEEADEPMTPKEVAELLGKSANAVKYLMWRMSKDGQLATAGKGLYSLTTNLANPLTANADNSDGSVSAVSEVSNDTDITINDQGEAEF
jgi:predicted transcriptional regulator